MRVLHLITSLEPGGIEQWLMTLLAEVPRDRCAMDICCKGPRVGRLAPEARALGAQVHHCRLRPGHYGFVRDVGRVLRRGRYDLAHVHLGAYSGLGVWLARRWGVRTVVMFHSPQFPPQTWTRYPPFRQLRTAYSRVSIGYALRRADRVTASSRAILEQLARDFGWSGEGRVLPLAVDLPETWSDRGEARAGLRSELGWPARSRVVMHVGSFREAKNHEGVLSVFERVRVSMPETRLALVGHGPLRPAIAARIEAAGLTGLVRCLGVRRDVPELLAGADLLLMPSTYEGFGLVAIEAGAVGLPVVASAVGGLREAVEDGGTGFLHPVDDVRAMAASVVRLLNDRELAEAMGRAGRARAEARYSPEASARQLLDVYDESLRSHHPLRPNA